MNQNLFVNFLDRSGQSPQANNAKQIHNKILEHRLAEMESREEILDHLRAIHHDRLWSVLGYKSLQAFCKKELGYAAREAREISISLGAILISKGLKSDDREIQARIDGLREWRRQTAAFEGVAAYRIFTNRTLLHLAHENPVSREQLAEINGLGEKRIEAFGSELLRALRSVNIIDIPHQPSLPSTDA